MQVTELGRTNFIVNGQTPRQTLSPEMDEAMQSRLDTVPRALALAAVDLTALTNCVQQLPSSEDP
ncbi:hypothetical protein K2224_33600 (plasmid) [Streptomyces sp. BHT-5-2]|uniref:hypothetical protein n=1 Tax=Streptomyces sp. BHT-5-2 TaxID=2866715 RepID=UPI001C8E3553|nr:hypothetical protein [Streptomyces sp. BHT-5-2]QZL08094.1 hypothetical protein K2224_33600 [Streptomyces sp. BHT-5-2]